MKFVAKFVLSITFLVVMEQDPMVNSAIGFDLGISKDFGIMTHRRESL